MSVTSVPRVLLSVFLGGSVLSSGPGAAVEPPPVGVFPLHF